MAERDVRERDILVAPGEYAYVQDLTKGDIVLYCGPTKISLSNTERMILHQEGRFVPVRGDEAGLGVSRFVEATSAQYIVLENPPKDPTVTPSKGANSSIELLVGRKIVVPGPVQFPLWPGQRAKVVDGHTLRQNEYLVVCVYDSAPGDDRPIGSEHIVRGTDVSFYVPSSGLEVVPYRGDYVRRAWRLEKNRGLHVRITKPYEAVEGDLMPKGHYSPGQDIFVRGAEGFFFPTSAIEVVAEVTPTPLTEMEGIYVRRLDTGDIQTIEGPQSYLPDPTREAIVTRTLAPNTLLRFGVVPGAAPLAPAIYVPPSTAVLVTAKNRREVVIGPRTRILHFDEVLEELTLSTGRPKSDDALLTTCFLQIEGNKVSDVVKVTTADHVELEVLVSYRVSFVGEPERWFAVRNYVGLLCDHLGSLIRAVARSASIEAFHQHSTAIVRDTVLGAKTTEGSREGRHFSENGMWVYDLEVLEVSILDKDVGAMLATAQRQTIESEISRKRETRRLEDERVRESAQQEILSARAATCSRTAELEREQQKLAVIQAEHAASVEHIVAMGLARAHAESITLKDLAAHEVATRAADVERSRLQARSAAFREEMQSLAPELISTLKTLGNQQLAGALAKHLSPLAILGGDSVAAVAERLLDRLPLGSGLGNEGIATLVGLGQQSEGTLDE